FSWTVAAWRVIGCCNAVHGTPITAYAGDTIEGTVGVTKVDGQYGVIARNLTRNTVSAIQVSATGTFSVATGGALEVTGLGSCPFYPQSGSIQFTDIRLYVPGPGRLDFNLLNFGNWVNGVSGMSPNCNYFVDSVATPNPAVALFFR